MSLELKYNIQYKVIKKYEEIVDNKKSNLNWV